MARPARFPVSIVWLRRDLRLDDNVALYRAAEASERVVCAFVLDPALLRGPRVGPPIVQFFFDSLARLRGELRELGSDLALLEGEAAAELGAFARRARASALFYSADDDPDAVVRDRHVEARLREAGIAVEASTDQVYYEAAAIMQGGGKPYVVYTPYRRRWMARFADEPLPPVPSLRAARAKLAERTAISATREVPRPEDYGHASSDRYPRGGSREAARLLARFVRDAASRYAELRNAPAVDGTSRLSPHLRAGTIGIRTVVRAAAPFPAWLAELIWRDFYHQLLAHHPRVAREPFRIEAAGLRYEDDPQAFAAWSHGRTGYPLVDAAMKQLNETGWMHNRLRMVAASFLTKHLLLDYRLGERYFEQRLADADVAANNGGWQWASSVGTDAAPYFRVFNPTVQAKTFDAHGTFVRSMLPALARVPERYVHAPWTMPADVQRACGCVIGTDYPAPIVDHSVARERAIARYGAVLARTPRGAATPVGSRAAGGARSRPPQRSLFEP